MATINSILIVDDDEDALRLHVKLMSEKTDAVIIATKHPPHALRLARDKFFDVCLIDITMNFNGSPFGGIDLHNLLRARYGAHSLLAYSQYITDDLLERYQCKFQFIEKSTDPMKFICDTQKTMVKLREQQTCFVAMPFSKNYSTLYECIKRGIQDADYLPIRLDFVPFTKSIIAKMFEEIHDAKVIVFVATDRNPNAFYECGYSVALDKEVITITDSHKNLPFDIRDRNAIAYGKDIKYLAGKLTERLRKLSLV